MSEEVVQVAELSRSFGEKLALDSLNFNVKRGCVYGLIGSNGAGKTTLIKHLLGLYRANSGTVRVLGLDPVLYPVEVLSRIGYLSEERELPEWMSIDELIRYSRAYYPNWDEKYANELLDTFRLDKSIKIESLSKGMRAQIGLITAVAHKPELLILDEPSSGLDPIVRENILDAIVRTVSDEGRTAIFSSHLLQEIEMLSDHVLMIDEGRVLLDDSIDIIKRCHKTSTVKFNEPCTIDPMLEEIISATGSGCNWEVIHIGPSELFVNIMRKLGGEVVTTRPATLQEVFIGHANHTRNKH